MKRNKLCPYKKHCRDECYEDNACSFAKAFDGLQSKIRKLEDENKKLREENEGLNRKLDLWAEPNF